MDAGQVCCEAVLAYILISNRLTYSLLLAFFVALRRILSSLHEALDQVLQIRSSTARYHFLQNFYLLTLNKTDPPTA